MSFIHDDNTVVIDIRFPQRLTQQYSICHVLDHCFLQQQYISKLNQLSLKEHINYLLKMNAGLAQYGQMVTCWHKWAVKSCGQRHWCNWPHYPAAWFWSHYHTWSLQRGQGLYNANLHKSGFAKSSTCACDQQQTVIHIVDMCPLTEFEGGLQLLHEAEVKCWNQQWPQHSWKNANV